MSESYDDVDHAPGKELVPRKSPAPAPLGFGDQAAYWTTIPQDTREGKRLTLAAFDDPALPLESMFGKQIHVQHVLMHPASSTKEDTGEVEDFTRIVLVTPDHTLYACGSVGVYRSLQRLWEMEGPGPWADPLVVEPYQMAHKPPRRLLKLRYLGRASELAPAADKKKK